MNEEQKQGGETTQAPNTCQPEIQSSEQSNEYASFVRMLADNSSSAVVANTPAEPPLRTNPSVNFSEMIRRPT